MKLLGPMIVRCDVSDQLTGVFLKNDKKLATFFERHILPSKMIYHEGPTPTSSTGHFANLPRMKAKGPGDEVKPHDPGYEGGRPCKESQLP